MHRVAWLLTMQAAYRPLSRAERALVYGTLGWAAEISFTAVRESMKPATRSWRLQGQSYLWMLPIYGLSAYLFEPLHDAIRERPPWQRSAAYAAGIMAVEYATGTALRRGVGVVPWDYSGRSRWALPGGAVRLDYAPVWAGAGLLLERVHDGLRTVALQRSRRSSVDEH
jgi:Putative ABC-transporter type IV